MGGAFPARSVTAVRITKSLVNVPNVVARMNFSSLRLGAELKMVRYGYFGSPPTVAVESLERRQRG
jgi:hypothetical protein